MAVKNDYWVLVPKQSEMNVSGTVADAFVVILAQGSALDKKLLGNYTGKVTVGGRSGYLRAGPFTTKADVDAYLKVGAQSTGTGIPGLNINPQGGFSVSNPLAGLSDIANFFDKLGQAHTWLRVAEVLLGLGLIAIGIAKMTNAVPIATKAAKTLGAVAVL